MGSMGGGQRKRIHHVKTRTPQILFSISQALVTVCFYSNYLISSEIQPCEIDALIVNLQLGKLGPDYGIVPLWASDN